MADSDSEYDHFEIPDEVSKCIGELCLEYKFALKKISELKKKKIQSWGNKMSPMKKRLLFWKRISWKKKKQDLLEKENDSFKEEISKVSQNFSFGPKSSEHILSMQIPYFNGSRLDFKKKSLIKNDFPNVKERLGVTMFTQIIPKNIL